MGGDTHGGIAAGGLLENIEVAAQGHAVQQNVEEAVAGSAAGGLALAASDHPRAPAALSGSDRERLAHTSRVRPQRTAASGQPHFCGDRSSVRKPWGSETCQFPEGQRVHAAGPSDAGRRADQAPGDRRGSRRELARLGADRKAVIIALGGGIAGDVGGLLASLYMRGIELVQIPTTVLAQVDSSIGGKTGVNLVAGKNLLGTFHHPRVVLIDPTVLKTLPDREFRAGLYEALKCGIIGNIELFLRFEQNSRPDPEAGIPWNSSG